MKSPTPASGRTGTSQELTSAQYRSVHYGYDLRGLQLFARYGSATGEGVTSVYDGFGRLASSSTNMGGTTRTLSHQYDRGGNRTRIAHPDGVQFDYAYDGLGRPTTLSDTAQALTHLYEPWGTVSGIIRNGGASGRWTTPDGRLISLSHYNGPRSRSTRSGHSPTIPPGRSPANGE